MASSAGPPPDDGTRDLVAVGPNDPGLTHIAVVGDTYTFLVTGKDSDGRYALIDMLIPPGGGPPPHRHAFEEMFHVLEGSIEVTFRDTTATAGVGDTVSVPANAPHHFHNGGDAPARILCTVAPAGLEEYFSRFGDLVESRTTPAPRLTDEELRARMATAMQLAASYGIENLPPD